MSTPPILQRLTKRAQFLYVRAGVRAGRGHVLIEARRRADNGVIGVGFTTSKKVGNAVARSRARRRMREAARRLLPEFGVAGVDYVLVARQSTPEADWATLLDDIKTALIRLRADLEAGAGGARPDPTPKSTARSSESD
jgi:ribonuclease P protein component